MSIEPTVARMIHYSPRTDDVIYSSTQVLAAILAGVNTDGSVNLAVFGADGSGPYARQNVAIADGYTLGCATWMPYQMGQAQRTAMAESQLTGAQQGGLSGAAGEAKQFSTSMMTDAKLAAMQAQPSVTRDAEEPAKNEPLQPSPALAPLGDPPDGVSQSTVTAETQPQS